MSAPDRRASVAHRGHGRTRLRFRRERGDAAFFDAMSQSLAAVPGIARVETRCETGSVLLLHEEPWPELMQRIEGIGLFAIAEGDEHSAHGGARLLDNSAPELVAAGGLAALAALQVLRGKVLPPTITLLWYAYELTNRVLADAKKE